MKEKKKKKKRGACHAATAGRDAIRAAATAEISGAHFSLTLFFSDIFIGGSE